MRTMTRSATQICVALALLALFAAPVARAAIELGAGVHSCCPQEQAPPVDEDAPCQQIAATACCLEIAVPQSTISDLAHVPALALAVTPLPAPTPPVVALRAVLTRSDGPPLPPLAQSGVLLL